jgi:hypothetical protein
MVDIVGEVLEVAMMDGENMVCISDSFFLQQARWIGGNYLFVATSSS